ncbi:hypothetical protein PtB15_3B412 [Puccinia triticina]|nr:hypothetical protein PtB15_3B412 [Puccinia triticina]
MELDGGNVLGFIPMAWGHAACHLIDQVGKHSSVANVLVAAMKKEGGGAKSLYGQADS